MLINNLKVRTLVVEVAFGIDWSGIHNRGEVFFVESVGSGGEDFTKVFLLDGALAFWVEQFESGEDNVFWVST